MREYKVVDGMFVDGKNRLRASCHHTRGARVTACGGCYYRLIFALEEIARESADAGGHIARAVIHALNEDARTGG